LNGEIKRKSGVLKTIIVWLICKTLYIIYTKLVIAEGTHIN